MANPSTWWRAPPGFRLVLWSTRFIHWLCHSLIRRAPFWGIAIALASAPIWGVLKVALPESSPVIDNAYFHNIAGVGLICAILLSPWMFITQDILHLSDTPPLRPLPRCRTFWSSG